MPRGAVPQQETFRPEQRLRENQPGDRGRGQVQGGADAGELHERIHWPRCYLDLVARNNNNNNNNNNKNTI